MNNALAADNLLIVNLEDDSDAVLKEAKQFIEEALQDRRRIEDVNLFWDAALTKDETLIAIGAAMMRSRWKAPYDELNKELERAGAKMPVDFRELGYFLSKEKRTYSDQFFDDKDLEKFRRKLLARFDATEYIWANTHYDECDNGFFYRRS